jgi:hypothetical protein
MSRRAHEQGDCNGDHTCVWCWGEQDIDEPEGDNE